MEKKRGRGDALNLNLEPVPNARDGIYSNLTVTLSSTLELIDSPHSRRSVELSALT
jgi:hypothetical protein